VPALNALAAKSFDGTSALADRVHFVHVYVVEPHPQSPDVSPYSGKVSEAQYSTKRQPRTYADRLANAREIVPLVTGNQTILVDDLTPGVDNPMWCSYGTCPNCAFLVRRDGTVDTVQTWFDAAGMERAMRTLLAAQSGANLPSSVSVSPLAAMAGRADNGQGKSTAR
jgi:hypothetical protein